MNVIMKLLMYNGHRAGVLSNMTMKEFYSGTWVDGQYVVTVHHHKTMGSHKAVQLVFDRLIFQSTQLYIHKVRPNEPENMGDSVPVFLLATGAPLNMATELSRHWRRATGENRRLNASMFRKGASSAARRTLNDTEFHQVNAHMRHNPETARQDYVAHNSKNESVKAVLNIRRSKTEYLKTLNQEQAAISGQENRSLPMFSPPPSLRSSPSSTLGSPPPSTLGPQPPSTLGSPPSSTLGSPPSSTLGSPPPSTLGSLPSPGSPPAPLSPPALTVKRKSKKFPPTVLQTIHKVFKEGIERRYINKAQGYLLFLANLDRFPAFNSTSEDVKKKETELKKQWQAIYDKLRAIVKNLKDLDA